MEGLDDEQGSSERDGGGALNVWGDFCSILFETRSYVAKTGLESYCFTSEVPGCAPPYLDP